MPKKPKRQITFLSGLSWMRGEPLVQIKKRRGLYYPPSYSSMTLSELNIRRGRK